MGDVLVIQSAVIVTGGVVLLALLVFQVLVGMRKVRFKGPRHMKVHKYGAWILVIIAVMHGFGASAYVLGW